MTVGVAGRSLISLKDFACSEIEVMLSVAERMAEAIGMAGGGKREVFEPMDKILAALFFEPSTRTRLSFEAAMLRLGGQVIGFADARVSSTAKGESVADTVRVVGGYCDIMVIRHSLMGAAKVAADFAGVPVINAGDGPHEHPTQTLTDLFAIKQARGTLRGLRIGLCGDLRYGRTVHSLAPVVARLGSEIVCIAPQSLQMPEEVLLEVEGVSGTRPQMIEDLREVIGELDVLYMTRIQKERFAEQSEYEKWRGVYVLTPQLLEGAREDLVVLHPLPRVDEIDPAVDADQRAWYFRQARGGVPVRMALISLLLGLEPWQAKGRRYGLDVAGTAMPQKSEPVTEVPQREIVTDAPPCGKHGCVTEIYPTLPSQAYRLPDGRLTCAYCERAFSGEGSEDTRAG
jgi:aspartate carbamoyltransferase catalytic subunit